MTANCSWKHVVAFFSSITKFPFSRGLKVWLLNHHKCNNQAHICIIVEIFEQIERHVILMVHDDNYFVRKTWPRNRLMTFRNIHLNKCEIIFYVGFWVFCLHLLQDTLQKKCTVMNEMFPNHFCTSFGLHLKKCHIWEIKSSFIQRVYVTYHSPWKFTSCKME